MFDWGKFERPTYGLAIAGALLAFGLMAEPAQAQFVCRDDVSGTAVGATATGAASVACGSFATASGVASTATGIVATASGDNSTATGAFSEASGVN